MAIEVFNRFENKFLVHSNTYKKIYSALLEYMELDAYNKDQDLYTISNLYFDTKDDFLIRRSLSKPKYKQKLRLRAYGIPKEGDKVFLEIKKKVCGTVNKRRTILALEEAYEFVKTNKKPELKDYMNPQVLNEIHYILNMYKLEPKLYLAYDRKALFGKEDKNLRITFDTNIRTRRSDLRLEKGDQGELLLKNDYWLMEIKILNSMPYWLSKLLSEHKIYKTSFSKYGKEYQNMIINEKMEKGELDICLTQYLTQQQLLVPQYL
jgi:SPX domain protein involved in polyphosphate accumulation